MAEQKKAKMSEVKREIRRRKKKHPEMHAEGINIYPMMDMMTILLVFMVMQFAQSAASAITQSEELQIPYSTSTLEMGDAVVLQISQSGIIVGPEQILDLRNGLVDPSQKQGGGTGFLITPLYRRMGEIRDDRKAIAARFPDHPFEGEVLIIADRRTPFRTLAEVIYTLGQTEFSALRFGVNKTRGEVGSR